MPKQYPMDTERRAWSCHYQLWTWLSQNPKKRKSDWPGWEVFIPALSGRHIALNYCSACEWSDRKVGFTTNNSCENCPITWGTEDRTEDGYCNYAGSPYLKWKKAVGEDRVTLALKIRDMWEEPYRELEYINIDDWNRPVFRQKGTNYYYSALDILFPYGESESEVRKKVSEKHLTYHGQSFDCDPMGTDPGKIKIIWSES